MDIQITYIGKVPTHQILAWLHYQTQLDWWDWKYKSLCTLEWLGQPIVCKSRDQAPRSFATISSLLHSLLQKVSTPTSCMYLSSVFLKNPTSMSTSMVTAAARNIRLVVRHPPAHIHAPLFFIFYRNEHDWLSTSITWPFAWPCVYVRIAWCAIFPDGHRRLHLVL